MKNYFKIGLIALTLAFGVTSCDKDDNGGSAVNALSLESQGLASKVTFNESVGIAAPKGSKSLTAKNHILFDHIYEGNQVLSITNGSNEVYTGTYPPNEINLINPASIILANGDGYVATSSNASYTLAEQLKAVIGYLPYTSEVDFNLSASTSIQLEATLQRGFLNIDSEIAVGGERITGVTANDVELIPADNGDYYGYLLAGNHNIIVTYLLNEVSTSTVSHPINIGLGSAYTLNPVLQPEPEAVVDSVVTSESETGLESEIGQEGAGRDINNDEDLLDTLTRTVTTTTPTLNGEPSGPGVPANGPWSIVLDTDVSVSSETVTSTEAAEGVTVNDDSDSDDIISRIITSTITSLNDVPGGAVITMSDWILVTDRSGLGLTESGTGTSNFVARTYSDWAPATAAIDVEFIAQTRSLTNGGAAFDPAIAIGLLERSFANSAYVVPNGTDTWAATGTYGGAEVLGDITYNAAPVDTSIATYTRIGTQAYSITASGTVETLTVVDAPDVVGSATGDTRQVEDAAVQSGLSREVSREENFVNPNYVEPSTDVTLSVSDFTDNGDLTFTGTGAAAGHNFVIGVALDNISYDYTYDSVTSDIFTPADGSVAADDAAYAAAIEAAIAAIQAQING